MPILGLEPTQFISESYWQQAFNNLGCRKKYADIRIRNTQFISEGYGQHAFKYLGCRKKNADIVTQTNTVYFRRLLATRLQLSGLRKEMCRYWDSKQRSLFPKATKNTRSTTWAADRNMPLLRLEPTQFISVGIC